MVFRQDSSSPSRLQEEFKPFGHLLRRFWITDSLPHALHTIANHRPFVLLSLADRIGDILLESDLREQFR